MKKSLLIVIIICFISLIGCTNNGNGNDGSEKDFVKICDKIKNQEKQKKFLGIELDEKKLDEFFEIFPSFFGKKYVDYPRLEFDDVVKNENYSLYRIGYDEQDAYYLCGYIPCDNIDILTMFQIWLNFGITFGGEYEEIINLFTNQVNLYYTNYWPIDFNIYDMRWFTYDSLNDINMYTNDDFGLGIAIKVTPVKVEYDYYDEVETDYIVNDYNVCKISHYPDFIVEDTNIKEQGKYLIFGLRKEKISSYNKFEDINVTFNNTSYERHSSLKIIENDNELYIEEILGFSNETEFENQIFVEKYESYIKEFTQKIIRIDTHNNIKIGIYRLEDYTHLCKSINYRKDESK